jgi:peptide/nickel transport system ATP-binding protein
LISVLEVEGLCVSIPVDAGLRHPVRDVSLSVAAGEMVCIVGESGCGKSLTALALMGLLPNGAIRSAIRLVFDGIDLLGCSEGRMADIRGNRMAMVFQDPMTSLNPAYAIGNQLAEVMLRHRGGSRAAARDRAVELLEKVGITAAAQRLGQYPHQLSGGLRQRVMIAMALMCEPRLIIADEPTTALDVTIQAQILHLLAGIQSEFGVGIVLITHDLGIVARTANRVAVMYAGQVVETGRVQQIFARPLHPYTQGLLRCIPIPGNTKPGQHLGSIPGLVPSLVGEQRGCSFRNRCRYSCERCATTVDVAELSPGRGYRCIMPVEQCEANALEEVTAG